MANSRYSVPMSLWLVDRNQRVKNPGLVVVLVGVGGVHLVHFAGAVDAVG
jgi:hypothetical protein